MNLLKKLNHRHYKFCQEFSKIGVSATEAARRAGFSPKSCPAIGCELKKQPLIVAELKRLKGEMYEDYQLDKVDISGFISRVLGANILDLFDEQEIEVGDTKQYVLTFKSKKDIPEDLAMVIKKVEHTRFGIRVELYDKLSVLGHLKDIIIEGGGDEKKTIKLIAEIIKTPAYKNQD